MSADAEEWRVVTHACEDCGSQVVSGLEPFDHEAGAGDQCRRTSEPDIERSEWCTNQACSSNHVLRGFHRVGVNDYLCLACNETLHAPMSQVFAHRRAHRDQSEEPGTHTYA